MNDENFLKAMKEQTNVTDEQSQQVGTPVAGTITDEHKNFASTITSLIDNNSIDLEDIQSFLKSDVYQGLDATWQARIDVASVNIQNQLRLIYTFYKDESFTNDSPQLQTMIEQLWQMKQKIEEHHDVFVF